MEGSERAIKRTRSRTRGGITVASLLISAVATAGVGVWTTNGPPGNPQPSPVIADPLRPGTLYAGQSFGGSNPYRSTDDGVTWTELNLVTLNPKPLATAPPATVYFSSLTCGETTCSGSVSVSTDNGATWRQVYEATPPYPSFQTVFDPMTMVVDPVTTTTLFLGQNAVMFTSGPFSGSLYKSADARATWTHIDSGLRLDSAAISTMIGTKVSGTLYVATQPGLDSNAMHGLFKTVDAGATWTQLVNAPSVITALATDPTNSSIIYAGTASGVFKSVDGGATFAAMNTGLTSQSISSLAINPLQSANVFVGTDGGVFQSVDGGATWLSLNNGLTDQNVNSLAVDASGGFLHAGTNTGVFDYQFSSSSCTADPHTLCLNNGRFAVTADFQSTPSGPSVPATAVPLSSDTGYFWFFDPTNIELVTKVLNGRSVNGEYWVFAGGLTDVGVQLDVTDTVTGKSKSYSNNLATAFQPIQDSSAFPCP